MYFKLRNWSTKPEQRELARPVVNPVNMKEIEFIKKN